MRNKRLYRVAMVAMAVMTAFALNACGGKTGKATNTRESENISEFTERKNGCIKGLDYTYV